MTEHKLTDEQLAELATLVDAKVAERLEEMQKDDLGLESDNEWLHKDAKRLQKFEQVWRNAGYLPDSKKQITFEELCELDRKATAQMRDNFSSDHPLLLERVVSKIAQEAIEPNLVLTPLLTRMSMPKAIQVVFPAWGAMVAGKVGEGEEYPEMSLELAGRVTASTGKYGVAVKMTDEMIRYSQFDVMSAHLRAAGKAMTRLKEQNIANLITENGTTIFNNQSTTYRTTTGRGPDGLYNGTLTLDDLFYALATMQDTGFVPNTMIMHPFAWQIFSQESIARAFGFENGIASLMWRQAQGQVGNAPSFNASPLIGTSWATNPGALATTFTNVPTIFPTGFSIVVSPWMPYNATTQRTDIVLCDRSELGVLIEDEALMTEAWDDPARDIQKVKFRERYGLAISNDGKGVGLLKNIKVARGYDFADKLAPAGLTGLSFTGDTGNYASAG